MLKSVREKRTAWLAERLDGLGDDDRAAIAAAVVSLALLLEQEDA